MNVVRLFVPALAALALLLPGEPARGECRLARVAFTPAASDLQMAVWLEDTAGNYLGTLFVTDSVGKYGIGNRPGRGDMNTAFRWPYGKRPGVLPVWAHSRNVEYPLLVFQDGNEGMLSHGLNHSTLDYFFCKPLQGSEIETAIDTGSCASWTGAMGVGTDKGIIDPAGGKSVYPPRNDMSPIVPPDSADATMFAGLNDLDALTRATPPGGLPYEVLGVMDPQLPDGDYVLMVETSREQDYNDTYNPTTYPAPTGMGVQVCCGDPYRGQPSVVYRLPFTMGGAVFSFDTKDYAGYGDIDGVDGAINPPDVTIDDTEGSFVFDQDGIGPRAPVTYTTYGASRLQLQADGAGMWRVRLTLEASDDPTPPGAPPMVGVNMVSAGAAALFFTAPGDDGQTGTATSYEVRYQAGAPLTEANFAGGTLLPEFLPPMPAGATLMFDLDGLNPETHYYVGVRGKDDCLVAGPITFADFTTGKAEGGDVDGCFVATAAFGSLMEQHVGSLRAVRDRMLRGQVLGELFVEAYYTFGPALAEIIEPSQDLRGLARAGLSPLTDLAATLLADAP